MAISIRRNFIKDLCVMKNVSTVSMWILFFFVASCSSPTAPTVAEEKKESSSSATESASHEMPHQCGVTCRLVEEIPLGSITDNALLHTLVTSVDNRHAAFARSDAKGVRVVRDGKDEQSSYDNFGPLAFSPDGNHLAYAAKKGNKALVVIDGKEGRSFEDPTSLVWSPTSDRLAFVGYEGNLCRVVLQSSAETTVSEPFNAVMRNSIVFSPDGKHLAYVSLPSRAVLTGTLYVDGKPYCKNDVLGLVSFGCDSKHWCYVVRRDGRCVVVVEDEKNRIEYPMFGNIGGLRLMPDGSTPVYMAEQGDEQLLVVAKETRARSRELMRGLTISPQGDRFAYILDSQFGQKMVLDGKEYGTFKQIVPNSLQFSTDGRRFSFIGIKEDGFGIAVIGEKGMRAYGPYSLASIPVFAENGTPVYFNILPQKSAELMYGDTSLRQIFSCSARPVFDSPKVVRVISITEEGISSQAWRLEETPTASPPPASSAPATSTPATSSSSALDELLAKRDYSGAIKELDRLIALDPKNVDLFLQLGRCQGILGNTDDALASLDQAIALDKKNVPAYILRAANKEDRKEYAAAIDDYAMAAKLDSDSWLALACCGAIRIMLGDRNGKNDFDLALEVEQSAEKRQQAVMAMFSRIEGYAELGLISLRDSKGGENTPLILPEIRGRWTKIHALTIHTLHQARKAWPNTRERAKATLPRIAVIVQLAARTARVLASLPEPQPLPLGDNIVAYENRQFEILNQRRLKGWLWGILLNRMIDIDITAYEGTTAAENGDLGRLLVATGNEFRDDPLVSLGSRIISGKIETVAGSDQMPAIRRELVEPLVNHCIKVQKAAFEQWNIAGASEEGLILNGGDYSLLEWNEANQVLGKDTNDALTKYAWAQTDMDIATDRAKLLLPNDETLHKRIEDSKKQVP